MLKKSTCTFIILKSYASQKDIKYLSFALSCLSSLSLSVRDCLGVVPSRLVLKLDLNFIHKHAYKHFGQDSTDGDGSCVTYSYMLWTCHVLWNWWLIELFIYLLWNFIILLRMHSGSIVMHISKIYVLFVYSCHIFFVFIYNDKPLITLVSAGRSRT